MSYDERARRDLESGIDWSAIVAAPPRDPGEPPLRLPELSHPVSTLFVAGRPVPQGSKDFKGHRRNGTAILVESAGGLKDWRARIAWAAHGQGWRPVRGPFAAELQFVMPRKKSTPIPTPPAITPPDVDKLARAVLDALTGVAWVDDAQVVDLHPRKRIAEPIEVAGVHITIERLEV